jgi:chromosome segregation ATPase
MGNLPRHFAVGMIIGLLIFPPLPAQAQWTVFDPPQYTLQVKKWIEETAHWVETVDQHTQVYVTLLEQLTTLKGVLKTVDTQLFKNQEIALLANDIGQILNDSNKLRRRLDGMVRYQIRTLKSIDDRLEQGIFDPDADMQDLQNYLLYTMGRDARQTVDQMKRLASADAQLAAWMDKLSKLRIEYATLNTEIVAKRKKLPSSSSPAQASSDDAVNIQHLNEVILQLETQAKDLKKRIDDLTEKISQRVKDYGLRMEDMENFAHQIDATDEMWKELQKTKADMQKTMDSLITGSPAQAQTAAQ